jgi:hypothetical protein
MDMNEYKAGSTGIIETIFLQDSSSTVGGGKTGLAYNTTGLTCYYKRSSGTAAVSVTLVDITTLGTFASGGFKAIDGTNMPGVYEFHPPNAAFAAGAKEVTFFFQGASGLVQRPIKFRLQTIDVDDGNAGLTGLAGTTAPTAGALPTIGAGTNQIAATAGAVTVGTNNDKTGYGLSTAERNSMAGAVWNETLTSLSHNLANSAGKILRTLSTNTDALYPASGTVNLTAATATTATLDAGASATAQIYRGNILSITGGTGSGQSRIITDYTTGRVATVDRAWVTNPDTTSTFEITPTASTQVASYAAGMDPATLTLGATASAWNTSGTVGAQINAGATSSDPWATVLPGSYTSGMAGYILGTNLNATMTSRQPSGNVTVGAYASGQSPETLVWDASPVGHNTASTFGNTVQGLTSGGGADPWTTSLPGSYGAGSAGYIVGTYINATISSRNSGNVTVGGYATNQDPAAYVLATPANKLATDSSGYVRVQSGTGAGQIALSSGGVQLADGVAHGGTPGSSTATLALQSINASNASGPAVTLRTTAGNFDAMVVEANGWGTGLHVRGSTAVWYEGVGSYGVGASFTGGAGGQGLYVIAGSGGSTDVSGAVFQGANGGAGVECDGGGSGGPGLMAIGGPSGGDGAKFVAGDGGKSLRVDGGIVGDLSAVATAIRDVDNTAPAANSLGADVKNVTVGGYAAGQDPASSVWGATVPASYVTGQAGYYAGASGVAAGKMTFDGFE